VERSISIVKVVQMLLYLMQRSPNSDVHLSMPSLSLSFCMRFTHLFISNPCRRVRTLDCHIKILSPCGICVNRMAALSDNLTRSLMRGSGNPPAKIHNISSLSVTYSFEPSRQYNMKRSKCSGIVQT